MFKTCRKLACSFYCMNYLIPWTLQICFFKKKVEAICNVIIRCFDAGNNEKHGLKLMFGKKEQVMELGLESTETNAFI